MDLSEKAKKVELNFCDAPCPGRPGVSCGSDTGYALVYSLESDPVTRTTGRHPTQSTPMLACSPPPTSTASTSSPPATTASSAPGEDDSHKDERLPSSTTASSSDPKCTAAIVIGSLTAGAAVLSALLLLVLRRRRRPKPTTDGHESALSHYDHTERPLGDPASGMGQVTPQVDSVVAPPPPAAGDDARRISQVSSLTSTSCSGQPSQYRQDISPVDAEPSNPAGLAVMNASRVVVRPLVGRASLVDTPAASLKRRYSLPVALTRSGFGVVLRWYGREP